MNLKTNDQISVNYYGEQREGYVRKIRTWEGLENYGELVYYLVLTEPVNKGTVIESNKVFIDPSSLKSGKCSIVKQN
jgi:hypothetical protein